jgi:hypothetical protein
LRHRPPDLVEEELQAAIARHWSSDLGEVELRYVPIGAGSYHWRAAAFFVTVDDLGDKPFLGRDPDTVYEGLHCALEIASALRRGGLEFVVAPLEGHDGSVLLRLASRYAVALYPYLDEPRASGRTLSPEQRSAIAEMLMRLHAVPPSIAARASQLLPEVPLRADLERALESEEAPALLLQSHAAVRGWLDRFDELVGKHEWSDVDLVVTHGEPHSRNVIRTKDGYVLVDWDTVGLAPRERDLWLVGGGDPELCELYRLRWRLDDVSSAVSILLSRSGTDERRERAFAVLRSSIEHEPFTRN